MGPRTGVEVSERRKSTGVRTQHRAVCSTVATPTNLTPAPSFEYKFNTYINLYSSTTFPICIEKGKR